MSNRRIRKGWRKVEEHQHLMSGIQVGIYIETETSMFDAEVDQQRFTGSSIAEVREKLNKYLNERAGVEWMDVLELELKTGYGWNRNERILGFETDRILVSSLMYDDRHLRTVARSGQQDTAENRLRDARRLHWNVRKLGEFKPPCADENRCRFYLPYSEELVDALDRIQERIARARANLSVMLTMLDDEARILWLNEFLSTYGEDK